MSKLSAEDVTRLLDLEPLGFEGGFYRENHRNPVRLAKDALPEIYGGARSLATAIYYMLTPQSFSLMHKLLTDEVYHFYLGDPAELLMLHPDGRHEVVRLGPDIANGERVQQVVPAGVWQGSRLLPGGRFALMGTTMAPGFELADFALGDRDALIRRWPDAAERIAALTPARIKTARLELAAATLDLLHAELRSPEALGAGLNASVPPDWPPPLNDEGTVRYVLDRLRAGPAQRGWWAWYVVDRATRDALGLAGYQGPPDDAGTVEIGYSVRPPHQGRGIATEAARALVARAFEDPRTVRVIARIEVDGDPASARVVEKLGFAEVSEEGAQEGLRVFERRRPFDRI